MEVHLNPELEARLSELARTTGRAKEELVQDVLSSYLNEIAETRDMLEGRYAEIKSGRVKPIDGEEAFATLHEKSQHRRNRPA
jgi:predicted DNA-binding protein